VTVTITYSSSDGKQKYEDTIPLDGRWMKLDSSSISTDSTRGRMNQMAAALGKIATESRSARLMLRDIAEAVSDEEQIDPSPEPGSYEDIVAAFHAMGVEPPLGENPDGSTPQTPAMFGYRLTDGNEGPAEQDGPNPENSAGSAQPTSNGSDA
jgi:hypothetical protein